MPNKKLPTGYDKKHPKKKKINHKEERKYLSNLFVPFGKKISLGERIVKFLIYVALRMVIRPSKWREPKKNFEIIDRTYKKIMSADFLYIPASIAFYLVMAFLPIITIITTLTVIPHLDVIFGNSKQYLETVMENFIPGIKDILQGIEKISKITSTTEITKVAIGIFTTIFISTWIASAGVSKMIYTQSHLYKFKYVGGYWMNKFKGMFGILFISVILALFLVMNIYVIRGIESLNMSIHGKNVLKNVFLYISLFGLIFVTFLLLFKLSPRFKIKFKHILPGTMVSTVPTFLFLSLFGFITSLWSYKGYGPIGAIMYVGMSALIVSYFMFVGLITNVAYYQTFIGKPLKRKKQLSRK